MAVENINNMTEGLAPADRSDVKDKNFKMPKAPGDKYVKSALNFLFKRIFIHDKIFSTLPQFFNLIEITNNPNFVYHIHYANQIFNINLIKDNPKSKFIIYLYEIIFDIYCFTQYCF